MRRTNQGGSILSFVVIGGIMVLLLIGGAYLVRHTLAPAMNKDTSVAQKDEGSSSDTKKDQTTSEDKSTSDEGTAPKTDENTDATTPGQTEQPSTLPSGSATPETHTLPTTGPDGALVSGVMLSSLVGIAALYVRSRRELASL